MTNVFKVKSSNIFYDVINYKIYSNSSTEKIIGILMFISKTQGITELENILFEISRDIELEKYIYIYKKYKRFTHKQRKNAENSINILIDFIKYYKKYN
jgi:hypothetical protein